MANLTVNSNYVGKDAGEIVGKAFKEADTIAKGLVTVLPDIDFQVHLKKIVYTNGKVDYTCGWVQTGGIVLSEKTLTPKKIMNPQEICKEDLRQIWSSATMGFSAHNDNMPADVESALIAEVLMDTAEATDNDIWNGDATNTGEFDGFTLLFAADGGIIKANNGIVTAAAPVDKTNVIAEIEKVLDAIPIALRRKTDLKFMVSPDIANFYNQALVSAGISNGNGGDAFTLRYGAHELIVVNGLAANTFVVAQARNLVFGTGLMSDHNELRIKDMDESDLSGQVRYKMVYTAGVEYYNPEEIVWYLTTTI